MTCAQIRFAEEQYNGLKNQGATCYLNSVLQCLYMTECFRGEVEKYYYFPAYLQIYFLSNYTDKIFLNIFFQAHLNLIDVVDIEIICYLLISFTRESKNGDEESTELIEELQKLFKMLKEHYGTTEGITRCLHISNVWEQQDVVEYYQKLLHMISPQMSRIFEGELKNSTKCLFGHKHEEKSPFFFIPLSIDSNCSKVFSVDMGIKNFSNIVKFNDDNLMYCDSCGQKSEAETWTEIEEFPSILTVNLKRFDFDYYKMKLLKNRCPVEISQQLKIKSCKYELYAVINHMGGRNGGHYNAVIKSFKDNGWYCFDDCSVTKNINFEQTLQTSDLAYLLMYRKEVDAPPTDTSSTNIAEQAGQFGVPSDYHTTNVKMDWGQQEQFRNKIKCVPGKDTRRTMHPYARKSLEADVMWNLERVEKVQINLLSNMQSYKATVNNDRSVLNSVTEVYKNMSKRIEELLNYVGLLQNRECCEKCKE